MRSTRSNSANIVASDITPERKYLSRRTVLAAGLGLAALQAADRFADEALAEPVAPQPGALSFTRNAAFSVTEAPNSYQDITTYNNYYEFGTDKSDPAENAERLRTRPWNIAVGGEAEVTGSFSIEDILEAASAGGANLSPALRGGVVDGGAMGRLSAGRSAASASSPLRRRSSSSSRRCTIPGKCPVNAASRARVAVHGRAAHR